MNLRQLVERADRPFASQPQVTRYFPSASIEDARGRLGRSIERGDGPGVVFGGAGIGKSLLLQALAAQYRQKFDVVLLACAQLCTRRALLQAIHFELGLDYRRRDEGELRLSLLDTLLSADESTQGLLLLVDEAQALANHLLEELRLLTNLSRGGAPRVRLVMAGLPSLEEKLATPELQSFSQRLAARCYLAPLTRAETEQYVRAQLAASHEEADRLVVPQAYEAIFANSDGVLRVVNQLCDRALVLADARGLERIDAAIIEAAWADLQQLPTACQPHTSGRPLEVTAATAGASVVEFGALAPPSADAPPPPVATLPAAPPIASPPTSQASPARKITVEPPPVAGAAKPLHQKPIEPPRASRPTEPICRPRVYSAPAAETVDPFGEPFEEEELVLESFATLASIFGRRTPRVENGRERGISRMVQNALDAAAVPPTESILPAETAAGDMVAEQAPRPTIRLAVVNDASPSALESQSPAAASEVPEEPILIIEDDSNVGLTPQPGVRRESCRQLFTRLRHGT